MKINKYFYFSYQGGKSKEIQYITKYYNLDDLETIVEPFCGSCAFSYYNYNINKEKKYILNDINSNLINLLLDIKNDGCNKYLEYCKENYKPETTKEEYNNIKNSNTLLSYFYINKIYTIRQGLYPNKYKNTKLNYDDYKELDYFYMSDNIELYNLDYKEIIEKYKDDDKALIFLDPPYFLTCNDFYYNKGSGFEGNKINKKEYKDPTGEYLYIRDALKNYKCKIIMIINDCELLKDYFKDFYKESYDKKYEMSKNKTKHMILSNLNINN